MGGVLTGGNRAAADPRGHADDGANVGISTCSNVTKVNRQRKRSRKSILLLFLVFCGDLLRERLDICPPLFRQTRQRQQKPTSEIVVLALHNVADKAHDLLVTRDLHEHLALAGAQPVLADVVCPADRIYYNVGYVAAYFVVCNRSTLNADSISKFLLC
nr:MAG TPA: hypothetical protein [Caudoviricetes sp.]